MGRLASRLVAAARWSLSRPGGRTLATIATSLHRSLVRDADEGNRLWLLDVIEHSGVASRSAELEPARPMRIQAPHDWDAPATHSMLTAGRALSWSLLENVHLNDTSSVRVGSLLIGSSGVHDDIRRGLRLKGPSFVAHDRGRVLIRQAAPEQRFDSGIRLCGFGSNNWYHWLVEILPTAMLIDRLPQDLRNAPLLVPEAIEHSPAWRDALDVVAPGRPRLIVPREGVVSVDRLVWLDPAVNGPRTLRDDSTLELDLLQPSFDLLRRFRHAVLERLGIDPSPRPGRRVLLVRPAGAQRQANQDDLIAIAKTKAFEPIDPGTLPFSEQVKLFAEAESIVGGWGAAWASMLFAASETRGLMWAPSTFSRWPLYSNLATISGMTLRNLWVETGERTMSGANKASQVISGDRFEEALQSIL